MPITVNSNPAAAAANFYMSKNNSALQKSINRLSSGSKIVHPNDDAGGLAVSMKLESMVVRLDGAEKNRLNTSTTSSNVERFNGLASTCLIPWRVKGVKTPLLVIKSTNNKICLMFTYIP